MAVVAALAVSVCLCVCFIDWEQGMIPDRFHIMLALLAIPATLLDTYDGWISHVIGAAAGGAALALVGFLVSKRIGREALGWGYVKFVAVSGAFLGWKRLLLTLLTELLSRGISKPVSTILTQVTVDPYDEAFYEPTKVIGRYMSKEDAEIEIKKFD